MNILPTFYGVIVLCASVITQNKCQAQTFDVRNCTWGMTIEQVKAAEGVEPISNGQELIGSSGSGGKLYSDKIEVTFRTQIGTKPTEIDYYFVANKLVSAKMRLYFNEYYNDQDFSAAKRLEQFGDVFRKFSSANGYAVDKYFTKGNFFSSRESQVNRLCMQSTGFGYLSGETAKSIQFCLSNSLGTSNSFYGIGASNARTNVFISFPPINSSEDVFRRVIGWVAYEPKQKVQTRDF